MKINCIVLDVNIYKIFVHVSLLSVFSTNRRIQYGPYNISHFNLTKDLVSTKRKCLFVLVVDPSRI